VEDEMNDHMVCTWEMININILVIKPQGKKPLGRLRCRWERKRMQVCGLDWKWLRKGASGRLLWTR